MLRCETYIERKSTAIHSTVFIAFFSFYWYQFHCILTSSKKVMRKTLAVSTRTAIKKGASTKMNEERREAVGATTALTYHTIFMPIYPRVHGGLITP
jgi:hypothetical protein